MLLKEKLASKKMSRKSKAPNTETLTQQYAAARSKSIVGQAIWTQRIVIGAVALIVIAAMVANYAHQRRFLTTHVDALTAYIVPGALDLLTVMCAVILALSVMSKESKWYALGGLVFAVGASSTLSALAPGDIVGKVVAGGMVSLIAVAEFVANHTHVDFRLLAEAETEFAPPSPDTPDTRRGDKREAIVRLLSRDPKMAARDIAKTVKCAPSYAAKCLRELKGELVSA